MRLTTSGRRPIAIALLLSSTLGTASCAAVSAAVDDASRTVQETTDLVQFCTAAVRVAKAIKDQDVDKAVTVGETMLENAPDGIAPAARKVLRGAQAAQAGDYDAIQSDDFRKAVKDLAAFTADRCDPR